MAATFDSLSTTKSSVLAFVRGQLPDWGLSPTQFFGKVSAVCTLAVYGFLKTARQIDRDAVPNSNTSTQGLDDWGAGLGLPRKAATAASGAVGTFSGSPGTVYPANTVLTASDGVTKCYLVADATVGGGGTVTGNINATTTGTDGNLDAGAALTVDTVPSGGTSSVTLTTGMTTLGTDQETNAAYLQRINARLADPPKAVTGPDLRGLAEGTITGDADAPASPAYRAYVYPLRSGTGTADVVVVASGSGQARGTSAAAGTIETSVDTTLQADRTVTAEITTMLPFMPDDVGLAIVVRVTPAAEAYDFDWDSYGTSLTVNAYDSGAKTLTLSGAAPADFQAAVTAGNMPRLQIWPTGSASPLPQQVRVTAYNSGTHICTLEEAFTDDPQVGDEVHAGGPVVAQLALAVRALVDSLGPSRASGYADPNDATGWLDTLYIDQLRRAVLDETDTDGVTPLVVACPSAPTVSGSSSDVQAADASPGVAPELMYAGSILILP